MASAARSPARRPAATEPPFADARVRAVFDAYPGGVRAELMAVRALIFATARATAGVGPLVETLKWGQPAYLPAQPRVGSTVRIDALKALDRYAVFFHCQTTLVSDFRERYPDVFDFQGNRAIVLARGAPLPREALAHCIALALTYHRR